MAQRCVELLLLPAREAGRSFREFRRHGFQAEMAGVLLQHAIDDMFVLFWSVGARRVHAATTDAERTKGCRKQTHLLAAETANTAFTPLCQALGIGRMQHAFPTARRIDQHPVEAIDMRGAEGGTGMARDFCV